MVLSNKKKIIFLILLILLIFLIFLIFFYKSLEDKKNIQNTFKLYDNFYISKLKNTNIPAIESASITIHKNKNYLTLKTNYQTILMIYNPINKNQKNQKLKIKKH